MRKYKFWVHKWSENSMIIKNKNKAGDESREQRSRR